jgi:hypothetical protein
MTAVQLPKTGLIKQDYKDKQWQNPLNQGFDAWESRVGVAGAGSPVGVAQGYFIGQTYFDTTAGILYLCTSPGTTTTTVWATVASQNAIDNFGNYVALPTGGIIAPVHHQHVLGYEANSAGSWTMQSGGFSGGWTAKIKSWVLGGSVTISAAPGASLVTMGARLTSLTLTTPDAGSLYTPDGVNFIWEGDRHYTSPSFALNAGAVYTYNHNLGVNPQRIIIRLTNIVSDLNYVPGDVVHISTDTQASNYGLIAKGNPTQVSAKIAIAGFQLIDWLNANTAPAYMPSWTGALRADVIN